MVKFKCVGTTPSDQNTMAEEIKSKSNSGNSSHHSAQDLLSFRVLSNNIKIKIWAYRTTVLFGLCACATASYIERKKQAQTARELGAEKDIWSLRGRSDGRLEETAQ
jgi:hypothetical protein